MSELNINGAFEIVGAARARLAREIDAVCRRHIFENELGLVDVVAVLEDCKFRRMIDNYQIRPGEDAEEQDDGEEMQQG